jgi:glycosyltransferase involved in cell wall biosynthesis
VARPSNSAIPRPTSRPSGPSAPRSYSVVICTYTEERWERLTLAIESALEQSQRPDEVLVVVDHNPDLLRRIESERLPVQPVPNRGPRGLSAARNTGLAEAAGDVIVYLDDDAAAEPGWLAELADAFVDPQVLGVGGAAVPVWQAGRRPGWFPDEFDWVVGCSYRGLPDGDAVVRNVLGCNMAFGRAELKAVGGFSTRLGRVGSHPIGAEETEVCIRLRQAYPSRTIAYRPRARVQHLVPPDRAMWRYFRARCYAEGLSKGVLSRMVGSRDGLASERRHAAVTLPLGIARDLMDVVRGDRAGLARAGAIGAGLALTTAGYLRGLRASTITGGSGN